MKPRRYDKSRGCYVYDISFKTRSVLSERTVKVAEAFGIGVDEEKEHVIYKGFDLKLAEGDVVYITGDSGSGKSALLRALAEDLEDRAIDMSMADVDPEKPLIETIGKTFQEALSLLSRVGLNDAFLFLRRYPELSDGQKYRYRIAKMIDSGKKFWLCDEFCSTLDRTTAKIVAFNMQKLARRSGATLIVATTHTDLEEDLNPSILIRKGWGEEISVEYRPNVEASECTAVREIAIRKGTSGDYHRLSYLHYREQRLPVTLRIYAMERGPELIGVIVYGSPPPQTAGRRQAVGYSPNIEEINRDWAVVSRVIIHPKYRTTGLGVRLVKDTLPLIGRRHVELVAVMAQYNPFAEHAGMKLIRKSEPPDEVTEAMGRLQKMGFNIMMMASDSYNSRKLQEMTDDQIDEVREILVGVGQYKRLASWSKPYGRKAEFRDWLDAQKPERLARCLTILSILDETKAYLYWCRDWVKGVE